MMTVGKLHRENHENTDEAIFRIEGLVIALDLLAYDSMTEPGTLHQRALLNVIFSLQDKLKELDGLRKVEWEGLGGS